MALTTLDDLSLQLRTERLPVALRPRQMRPCRGGFEGHIHLVVLATGSLRLELGDAVTEISAPAGLILPPSADLSLRLEAGSEGWLFGLAPHTLGEVMGPRPEMDLMLPLGRHPILATFQMAAPQLSPDDLATAIIGEVEAKKQGHRLTILAYLRLLIVEIWRAGQSGESLAGFHGESHLIESFRHEVEVHFRNHLPISGYAAALHTTPSRLRRICLKHLGRSPLQLVHRRVMREAVAWLDHSGRSIADIALALGFADATEFSHFFKRNAGLSPSHFREKRQSGGGDDTSALPSFADWP